MNLLKFLTYPGAMADIVFATYTLLMQVQAIEMYGALHTDLAKSETT